MISIRSNAVPPNELGLRKFFNREDTRSESGCPEAAVSYCIYYIYMGEQNHPEDIPVGFEKSLPG
jgi:hypothetical protein